MTDIDSSIDLTIAEQQLLAEAINDSFVPNEPEQEVDQELEQEPEPEPINIPSISPTLLSDDTTTRFSSAPWFETVKNEKVALIGCGGIGSWTGLLLSRLQIDQLVLFDEDTVEEVNMAGQWYRGENIEMKKVDALSLNIMSFSNYYHSISHTYNFTEDWIHFLSPVVICGLDNMRSRKLVFEQWLLKYPVEQNSLFIDGRMSAEELQIFCMRRNDEYSIKQYQEHYLFSDDNAEELPCSYKQTSFCASMIASLIANLFVNYCVIKKGGIRSLPFYTYYNAETMYLKEE